VSLLQKAKEQAQDLVDKAKHAAGRLTGDRHTPGQDGRTADHRTTDSHTMDGRTPDRPTQDRPAADRTPPSHIADATQDTKDRLHEN
jgi:hypothetical protein